MIKRVLSKPYNRYLIYGFLSFALYILLICSINNDLAVKIIYGSYQEEDMNQNCDMKIGYREGESVLEETLKPIFPQGLWGWWFEVTYSIPEYIEDIQELEINLLRQNGKSRIKSIEIYNNNLQVAKYAPVQIQELFEVSGDTIIDSPYIRIFSDAENTWIRAKTDFLEQFKLCTGINWRARINYLFFCALLCAGVCCADLQFCRKKSLNRERVHLQAWEQCLRIMLGTIFVSASVMVFRSPLYVHADEVATKMGIDYFLGNWITPYADSNWVAGTFSSYGNTRVLEDSLYYLVAGKVGWLFLQITGLNVYFRISNLICLGILLTVCWKYRQKHKWMFLALGLTPQLWYTFSYGTSDAWDYFWCFCVIWILLEKESKLNKIVKNAEGLRTQCLNIIACAFVFAMVWLGKTNYLVILGLAFIDLLIKWVAKKMDFKLLLGYILIFAAMICIVVIRQNMPVLNGDHESVLTGTSKEQFVLEDLQQTESESRSTGLRLRDRGYSLTYVLQGGGSNISFLRTLFTSTLGVYFGGLVWSGKYYLLAMGFTYILMAGVGLKFFLKEKNRQLRIKMLIAPVWFVIMIGVVIMYCWYKDYQPQGRYILPLFLVVAYSLGSDEKLMDDRWMRILPYASTMLGLYSFWFVAIARLL